MKKAFLILIGIFSVTFLVSNADFISSFVDTLQTGATLPIVVALVAMVARHLVQAASYDAAFEAVGYKTGFWHNVILIFNLVFINTFCLFSGATGVAFIIDDAHRKGADLGTATSGAILSQIGYFAAVFVISVIGFASMLSAGTMNPLFIMGGLILGLTLVGLSSLFVMGYLKPDALYSIFQLIENGINIVLKPLKKHLRAAWGSSTADSIIKSARILAHNPLGAFITVAYAALSALLNMACLVAIGYAFGFDKVAPLVAAFAVAAISVILSPSPQGVGVAEAAITVILTAHGSSFAAAGAIALVYRGIMFWIPFCIGALSLTQSGFFKTKKDSSVQEKNNEVGWIAATLVGLVGVVNIGMISLAHVFAPYGILTQWLDLGGVFGGQTIIVVSIILILLSLGLVFRYRLVWALALTILVFLTGSEFLFADTFKVALPILFLITWLFHKRNAFDRVLSVEALQAQWTDFMNDLTHKKERRAHEHKRYIEEKRMSDLELPQKKEQARLEAQRLRKKTKYYAHTDVVEIGVDQIDAFDKSVKTLSQDGEDQTTCTSAIKNNNQD